MGQVLKAGKKGEWVLVRYRNPHNPPQWLEGYYIAAEELVMADLVIAGALPGLVAKQPRTTYEEIVEGINRPALRAPTLKEKQELDEAVEEFRNNPPKPQRGHFLPPVVMEPGGRMTTLEGAVTLRIEVVKAALIIVTDKTVAVNDELKHSARALLLSEFKSATRNNEDGQ